MLYFKEDLKNIRPAAMTALIAQLRQGKVVVLPTDTIYGLSCLATKTRALKKIEQLKRRAVRKPFIILMANLAMLKKYTFVSRTQAALLKKLWAPGQRPTTVILPSRGLLPPLVDQTAVGLACRLPKKEFLIKILKTVKQPVVSTSLNISGQAPLRDVRKISKVFKEKNNLPAAVLDIGLPRQSKPSRLLDLRNPKKIMILRA